MIKRILVLILASALISPVAYAATSTPAPKAKVTKKATPTKKPVVKKKAVVKKKSVKKKSKKKKSIAPSPSPKWPPSGFKSNGEVFAKVPSAKELVGTASNSPALTRELGQLVDGVPICEKFSCGAVQVASLNGCTWWEVEARVIGKSAAGEQAPIFGVIRVASKGTAPKQITTILLASQEPLELHHFVGAISANCHHDAPTQTVPSSTYTPVTN